eukprot:CAMPEP_0113897482 /NCGR_PEP_ID=MMETSP0780_2-20120614/18712_1 /TAXON_ID=652834 /ORGANISM="Palpitomonas bilix" /LENGTH=144 /DNA_ID=CAMNT_0000888967 /DNA_START=91 /DNA_END=525 /DNA_ORIENTATION=- /assembly_acc=CAM_ASM_000599
MRHGINLRKLGRDSAHRLALFRNAVTSLIKQERIETTLPKAKEIRRFADKMVTLGKEGSLHSRRQALGFVQEDSAVKKLFDELADRYKDREGGYTRVLRSGRRKPDNATMAYLEFVDRPGELRPAKAPAAKAEKTTEEVKQTSQ